MNQYEIWATIIRNGQISSKDTAKFMALYPGFSAWYNARYLRGVG